MQAKYYDTMYSMSFEQKLTLDPALTVGQNHIPALLTTTQYKCHLTNI